MSVWSVSEPASTSGRLSSRIFKTIRKKQSGCDHQTEGGGGGGGGRSSRKWPSCLQIEALTGAHWVKQCLIMFSVSSQSSAAEVHWLDWFKLSYLSLFNLNLCEQVDYARQLHYKPREQPALYCVAVSRLNQTQLDSGPCGLSELKSWRS